MISAKCPSCGAYHRTMECEKKTALRNVPARRADLGNSNGGKKQKTEMVEIIMSETIADIVAEMREHNKETTPPYVCFTEEGGIDLSQIIDRIEAVTKCNQPEPVTICNGLNAAKMREALETAIADLQSGLELAAEQRAYMTHYMRAALSAPPRNCDKCLTPKDAMLAHLEEVYEGEKVEFGDYEWCEFVKWLFAEAKEFTNK